MKTRIFLIFCAVGLVPIALGYGAKPSATLDALFGITVDTTNLTHIMRAVMGLYFGMVVIWVWGALCEKMTAAALVSCAVFMLGLAAGRLLSFILDGTPHWLLIAYAGLETGQRHPVDVPERGTRDRRALRHTLGRGRVANQAVGAGLLGLIVLISALPYFSTIMRYRGGGYLVYLGITMHGTFSKAINLNFAGSIHSPSNCFRLFAPLRIYKFLKI